MTVDSSDWEEVGYVVASDYRRDVLEALGASPATPTTLAQQTGYDIAHVSRALQELRDREMVDLLVPEDRKKGRIYGIKEPGVEALEHVERLGGGTDP